MEFRRRTLEQIAGMICGHFPQNESFFPYRTGRKLTNFFQDCSIDCVFPDWTYYCYNTYDIVDEWLIQDDSSDEKDEQQVIEILKTILNEPKTNGFTPPKTFLRVIETLMDYGDAFNEGSDRPGALALLNDALFREGYEAFYAPDKVCHLKHIDTNTIIEFSPKQERPLSPSEIIRKKHLSAYLNNASTAVGHKDKALEYGKDIWMKYTLPTRHVLYFGVQVKKGKLDASGNSKAPNNNIAEVYNQVSMMLGSEVFDPETSKRTLVDHAFIIAGGEITKQAENWLFNKLDVTKRSQVMFMDKTCIVDLFIVTNLPLPSESLPKNTVLYDEVPF